VESHRARLEGDRRVTSTGVRTGPLRLLLSPAAARGLSARVSEALGGAAWIHVAPGDAGKDFDVAFVTREVTGLSTKHEVQPSTQVFYDALLAAPSLQWVQVHSAGADRPVYVTLRKRGVMVTTSSGANAPIVALSALSGILGLARHLPLLMMAQRERRWAPLYASGLPRDLEGQTAVVVGWGPIGQRIGALLQALGLRISVARQSAVPAHADIPTVQYRQLPELLPQADWLVLCCPLSAETRLLVDAATLGRLPPGAHVVNVARGDVMDEDALIAALRSGALAGAYLDVFAHEPLPSSSALWALPNVIVTPHCAGLSDGNEGRVAQMFLENLGRWVRGEALAKLVTEAASQT
jgi:phosphoglycerate dehydrogenase-like enzyme